MQMTVQRTKVKNPDDIVQLTIMAQERLRRLLSKAADKNVRSLNGEVIYRLSQSFVNKQNDD
jgi:hypothetical protein